LDQGLVGELACSIRHLGLLQPILVRPLGPDAFEVVFGLHRIEAYRKLGRRTIPAIVRAFSSEEAFLARIAENLSRNIFVDPIVEAKGYIALIEKGWTIGEVAKQIGKSDSYVSDRLGLVRRLHPSIVRRVSRGGTAKLTSTHAVLLSRVKDHARQLELADFVEMKHLSARQLEELIRRRLPVKFKVILSSTSDQVALPSRVLQRLRITPSGTVYAHFKGTRMILETAGTCSSTQSNLDAPERSSVLQ
jgi:ParB family chromosome partitioning protein